MLHQPGATLAFEVASAHGHPRRGLRAFLEGHPKLGAHGYLVAPTAPLVLPHGEGGLGSIPLDLLLLAASAQAEQERLARLGGA